MIQRPFSSGSRQAPDPHDNFLEEAGYYRKHTARDSSCLFRAISEQMYDTQTHHLSIRQTCVDYMRKNKEHFQYDVDKDIDDYLAELSKPKTFGSLLELRAMAYMYQRNVILFRPMDRGTWWLYEQNFAENFQIFISHEKHFDTVYTNEFIQDAAFCQSICYEILYKKVFKLPDVTYAVERMLHAASFENIGIHSDYDGFYCRRMKLDDGRTFDFDSPESTSCILNNSNLCHFHNPEFIKFTDSLQNETNLSVDNDQLSVYGQNDCNNIYENRLKTIDALLPEKHISCVRQLLSECITPFPYKVAKALDPDMYRNIEFDSWSEMRKEIRFKNWYSGGTTLQMYKSTRKLMHSIMDKQHTSPLQVGVKCQVYLRKSDEVFTGYIQEMSGDTGPCIVFIEQLGEKRVVQYDCLKPLPPDQIKPWALPYRLQKHLEKYNNGQTTKYLKRYSHKYKYLEYETYEMESYPCENHHYCSSHDDKDEIGFKLKQYCSIENFTQSPCEMIAMPLTVEQHNRTPIAGTNNLRSSSTPRLSNNSVSTTTVAAIDGGDSLNGGKRSESSNGNPLEIYVDENGVAYEQNSGQLLQNGLINCHGIMGEPQYTYGYAEPCYGFQYADSSIIHAAGTHNLIPSAGPQYYCMYPAPTAAAPSGVTHNVYMQPPPIPQAIHCNGQQLASGYYQAPPPYYATTIPSVSQIPGCSNSIAPINANNNNSSSSTALTNLSRGSTAIENNVNVNYSVSKSVHENGTDLPHDTATLRFFFNLGWDYYHDFMQGGGGNDKEVSKLAIEFQKKTKIENESSNMNKQDSNSNLDMNSNNQQANINQHGHSERGGSHNKRFNARYFSNRKSQGGGYRGGNNGHHRYSSMNAHNKNNTRNNDYNNNRNNSSGGSASGSNNQLVNTSATGKNSNSTTERNNTSRNSGTDLNNQPSPATSNNDNIEYVQTPPLFNTTHTTTPVYTSFNPFNECGAENQTTGIQNNIISNGGGLYVPHLMPMSFGMCTTTNTAGPPPPGPQQSSIPLHNSNSSVGIGGSYQYITTTGPPPPNHPPPPIQHTGIPIPATSFPPPQHPGSYYFTTTQTTPVTNTSNDQQQTFIANDGSTCDQQYSLMNYPATVYYSNGTGVNGSAPTPTGNYHQGGYWYPATAAPPPSVLQSQTAGGLTPTTTSTNPSKMNYSGTSNISH